MPADTGMKRKTDVQAWHQARTLDDIGALTARWIEGGLTYHPCYYGGSIDEETSPLQKLLTVFNRKGFVTTCSQPARSIDAEGYGQRAWVEGYAREELAKQIATLGLYTDLVVLIFPPGTPGGYQLPITVQMFHPYTWTGGCWGMRSSSALKRFAQMKPSTRSSRPGKSSLSIRNGGAPRTCGSMS